MTIIEQVERRLVSEGESVPVTAMYADDRGVAWIRFESATGSATVEVRGFEQAENIASAATKMAEWLKAQERAKRAGG